MNINKGTCLSERLVGFNPLLLIHATVSGNGIDDRSKNNDRTIKTNEQSKSPRNIKRLQATL